MVTIRHRRALRVAGAPDGLGSARIAESAADVVVFEDSDPLMDTLLIGRNTAPDHRVFTTVLSYRRRLVARVVWAVVGILHRRTAASRRGRSPAVTPLTGTGRAVPLLERRGRDSNPRWTSKRP